MTATLIPTATTPPAPGSTPTPGATRVPRHGVIAPTVASGVAVLLSSLALTPLFADAGWLGATVLVVLAVTAAGGVATWLRAPLVLVPVVQAVVLFAVLVARFTDEAPWGFVPTPDSMRDLRAVLAEGVAAIDRFAPPVPTSEGIAGVVALGVGCVALTVFVLQVSLRIPTAAGIPLIAMYVVPSSVLSSGSPWWAFVVVIAGWLILLVTDERLNLLGWGRMLRRPGRTTGTAPLTGLSSAALRLGSIAVLAAIALPILIPGLADAVIGRVTGGGVGPGDGSATGEIPGEISVDPFVSLRRDLIDSPDVTVLRYTTTATTPSYLRLAVLEAFDGVTWKPRQFSPDDAVRAADGTLPPAARDAAVRTEARRYDFVSDRLVQQYLPVPEEVTALRSNQDWFVDRTTGTVFGIDSTALARGDQWSTDSLEVTPTAAQLDAAPDFSAQIQADLVAGTPIPPVLTLRARELTAGTTSKHEAAVAIQAWLRTFTYSTPKTSQPPAESNQSSPYLEQFLAERTGYCQQFAATMALMARSLGIPAHVVVGFTPGTRNDQGERVVSGKDAHAWPELLFQGIGWVRFEPTPRGAADGGSVTVPGWAAPAPLTPEDRRGAGSGREDRLNERRLRLDEGPGSRAAATQAAAAAALAPVDTADLWRKRALAALAVLALVAMIVPASWRWLRRRRRLAATGTVEDAWSELRDSARDLGVPWSEAHTPRQAAAAVIRRQSLFGDAAEATTRLARATEQVRYAPTPPSAADLADDVTTVRGALWRRADNSARVRAVLLPASLRRPEPAER